MDLTNQRLAIHPQNSSVIVLEATPDIAIAQTEGSAFSTAESEAHAGALVAGWNKLVEQRAAMDLAAATRLLQEAGYTVALADSGDAWTVGPNDPYRILPCETEPEIGDEIEVGGYKGIVEDYETAQKLVLLCTLGRDEWLAWHMENMKSNGPGSEDSRYKVEDWMERANARAMRM